MPIPQDDTAALLLLAEKMEHIEGLMVHKHREDAHWHLKKEVTVAHLLTSIGAIALVVAAWFSMNAAISSIDQRTAEIDDARITRLETTLTNMDRQMSNSLRDIKSELRDLNHSLDDHIFDNMPNAPRHNTSRHDQIDMYRRSAPSNGGAR